MKKDNSFNKVFATRLEDKIKDSGKNYIELQKITGIPDSTINAYVNYRRGATAKNISIICSTLKISSDFLLGLSPCSKLEDYKLVNKTGLSDKSLRALESINKSNPKQIETLNFLLSSDISGIPFANFLYYLSEYIKAYRKSLSANKRELKARRLYAKKHNITYQKACELNLYNEEEFIEILNTLPPDKNQENMDISMFKAQKTLQRLMDFSIDEMHKKEKEQPRIKKRNRRDKTNG